MERSWAFGRERHVSDLADITLLAASTVSWLTR
jgi:hypothetical protein